jgi:hypothetical protein
MYMTEEYLCSPSLSSIEDMSLIEVSVIIELKGFSAGADLVEVSKYLVIDIILNLLKKLFFFCKSKVGVLFINPLDSSLAIIPEAVAAVICISDSISF